jgi:hypothetical protein
MGKIGQSGSIQIPELSLNYLDVNEFAGGYAISQTRGAKDHG